MAGVVSTPENVSQPGHLCSQCLETPGLEREGTAVSAALKQLTFANGAKTDDHVNNRRAPPGAVDGVPGQRAPKQKLEPAFTKVNTSLGTWCVCLCRALTVLDSP